ncbi:fasciclin domain-containing protein [Pontibacter silvestris]|uniref:Fasciclin domain-containing protein n=1 Tax=Pontibacter silvestris TaxID=2305183 RepID=A0ABW4WZ14_9BACT|nr:fasciclin domain-containing protein [Pontibacter silvestris]MCC9135618.1 fasciclin domain-containing protein [Pontibacter silvestris]
MKKTQLFALSISLLFSTLLLSCNGTNEENSKNEAQREARSPDLRMENKVNPASHYSRANTDEAPLTSANVGGNEMFPSQNVVANITSSPKLTTFTSAIKKADLTTSLNGTGPYTVFAPSDKAFEAIGENTFEDLMKPENKQQLAELLNNHVVSGMIQYADLKDGSVLRTVGGKQLQVSTSGNKVMVNGAEVENIEGESSNGTVHIVNKVLTANNS